MSTREHRVIATLRSLGRFRRVNFGRNDYKMILKNPELRRRLLQSKRESEAGQGIEMSLEEFRRWLGTEHMRTIRSMGGFRRVNFGRNDSKLILKNPELRRRLREAEARIQAGLGIRVSVEELRSKLGIEP